MLIRFEVENFRSLRDPAELSMVAIDEERSEVRPFEKLGASLLTTAGIFGPNASGKSNILAALAWLRAAIEHSLLEWDDKIPVEPFAFGDGSARDSSFVLEMLVSGVRFEYLLDLNSHRVAYEALYHYPEGRRRRIFEREKNDLVLQRGLGELAGTRSLLTDRSLALTIMRRFDEPSTSAFAHAALGLESLGQPLLGWRRSSGPYRSALLTMNMFDGHGDSGSGVTQRDRAMSMLRLADLGIVDVRTGRRGPGVSLSKVPQLVHSSGSERMAFKYEDESAGTKTWFELIAPLLTALQEGSVVLFDELSASLHPTLTSQLVRLFQGRSSNPKGAQLLFTSHDTNLLNHLNRDEVWLTQKDADGATRFAALSDFAGERVRRSQNIESGYLSGRFGALPDITRPDVLRELGLIG